MANRGEELLLLLFSSGGEPEDDSGGQLRQRECDEVGGSGGEAQHPPAEATDTEEDTEPPEPLCRPLPALARALSSMAAEMAAELSGRWAVPPVPKLPFSEKSPGAAAPAVG